MPYYLVSAETSFSAAHQLPGVDMCERMHGHDWRVRLTLRVPAEAIGPQGMAVDFRAVEDVVRAAVSDFEHRNLNELPPFATRAPTAEHVARIVCERIEQRLPTATPGAQVAEVEIWETPKYRVVYRPA